MRLLPLLCFLWYYGNITFCAHTHIVDGKLVVHSHAGRQHHNHQSAEFNQIYALSHVSFLKSAAFSFGTLSFDIARLTNELKCPFIPVTYICYFSLRAPPALG